MYTLGVLCGLCPFFHKHMLLHICFFYFFNSLNEGVMGMQTGGGKAVQYYYRFLFLCSQESTGSEQRGDLAGGCCDGPE